MRKAQGQPQLASAPAPDWVIDMNNDIKEGVVCDSGKWWTIYRVPKNMRGIHRNAFLPKIISIGPFHYKDPGLRIMEQHKMRYLLRVLEAGPYQEEDGEEGVEDGRAVKVKGIQLEELAEAMGRLEQKTRERYSEDIPIDSDEFVQMMVIDGCFVLQLLLLFFKFDNEVRTT